MTLSCPKERKGLADVGEILADCFRRILDPEEQSSPSRAVAAGGSLGC